MSALGVAAVTVKVGGSSIDATVAAALVEVLADGRLRVPDRLSVRFRDDDFAVVDGETFAIGSAIEVLLGAAEASAMTSVFDGQITALEPEFTEDGAAMVVCALDRGHLLQREARTATYQQMSYGEIATKLATGAGLVPGEISDGLRLDFIQQSNETDWDFLWRLALDVDYELKVRGKKLSFGPAGQPTGTPAELTWGDALLAFRPRVTGVGQVEEVTVRGWDPALATAIEATATAPAAESRMGVDRDEVVEALSSGGAALVDHPVTGLSHAQTIATSLAAQLASVYVEGEGTAEGMPGLVAGGQAQISGVGETFSGTYAVTGVRHAYRRSTGYRTDFAISGRAHRTLLGLSRPPVASGWDRRIVVGVVTNTSDEDQLGRVRVKYPALDDSHEGWWARVVAPGSGATRGLFSLPQVGDEVLIVFEHGNEQHPYLLGSVFNGTGKPGTVVQSDGSFTLATPHKVTITATEAASLTTNDALKLTSIGTATLTTKPGDDQKPAGDIQLSAKGALGLAADAGVTLGAGAAATMSAKSAMTISGATVEIKSDGTVTIKGATLQITGDESVTISAPSISLG
jgi:phage protein D